jgi:serine/threonine-protein kinase
MLLQNRYRVLDLIGGGGMGFVYLAEDLHLGGQPCAIKVLPPDQLPVPDRAWAVTQFQHEARLLAGLNHHGIVQVRDHFFENGDWYLVMDYVPGQSLAAWLGQLPQGLPVPVVLNYAAQLCAVLEYLHGHNPPVIFRDLKPGNIMISQAGEVKLIDFGIARFFKPGRSHNTINLGTPGYASPEHSGSGQTDLRSDIYSLGVLLHQLLTGYDPALTPFNLPSARQLNQAVSAEVDAVIRRATQLRPDQRFQSVPELRAALFTPAAVKAVPTPVPTPPKSSRSSWVVGLVGLGLAAIGLLAVASGSFNLPTASRTPTPASGATISAPGTQVTPSITPTRPSLTPRPGELPPPSPTRSTALRVAFSRGPITGCSEVVVIDTSPHRETLYRGADNTSDPSWSPDGTQLVANTGGCARAQSLIVFKPPAGAGSFIPGTENGIEADWGNDDRIYFVRGDRTQCGNYDLYSIKSDGSDRQALGQAGRYPALSPDARQLAYMRNDTGLWRIWIAPLENGGTRLGSPTQLPVPAVTGGAQARVPSWTADGARVIFNITDQGKNCIFKPLAMGSYDVATGSTQAVVNAGLGARLGRPACGAQGRCVAHDEDGGIRLLTETDGRFSLDRQPFTDNPTDWGPDLYP